MNSRLACAGHDGFDSRPAAPAWRICLSPPRSQGRSSLSSAAAFRRQPLVVAVADVDHANSVARPHPAPAAIVAGVGVSEREAMEAVMEAIVEEAMVEAAIVEAARKCAVRKARTGCRMGKGRTARAGAAADMRVSCEAATA